jgi:uncharacterized membrane protein
MQNSRKWMIAGLVVSVVLNLALAGFVVGRMLEPRLAPPRMDPSLAVFPALRELPEARREALRPIVREQFRHLRGDMRRMRHAQRSIHSTLTTEPFSEVALADALAEFRTALLASQEGSHAALVRLAQALTPEERRMLATAMRGSAPRPFRPGSGRMHGPPPAETPPP